MHALPINSQKNMHYQASFTDITSMQSNKNNTDHIKAEEKYRQKKAAQRHVFSCLFVRHKAQIRIKLFTVSFVRNSKFFTTLSTTRCENATTILSLHTLTESVLVNATAIVWLKCSFHILSNYLLIFNNSGCKST